MSPACAASSASNERMSIPSPGCPRRVETRSHPRLCLVEKQSKHWCRDESTLEHRAAGRHFRLLPPFRHEGTVAGAIDQSAGHRVALHRLEDHLLADFFDAD